MNLLCDLGKVFKPSLEKEVNLDFCAWKSIVYTGWKHLYPNCFPPLLLICFSPLKPVWLFWPELFMVMVWRDCAVWWLVYLLKISLSLCVWNCI